MLKYESELGIINITTDAVAKLAGSAATKSFGVAGMAFKSAADGIVSLLKPDNLEKGVRASTIENEIIIDLHIIVTLGINITEIVRSITHNVIYAVEKATGFKVRTINVFVDSVK